MLRHEDKGNSVPRRQELIHHRDHHHHMQSQGKTESMQAGWVSDRISDNLSFARSG